MSLSTRISRLTTALAAAGLFLGVALSATAADIPAEKRIPKDVLFYLNCPSFPQLSAAFQKTALWEMAHDPAMKAFRDHVAEKIKSSLEEAKSEVSFPIEELPSLLAGEFTLAVTKPFGEPLGGLLLLEIKDRQDLLNKLLDKVDSESEEFSRTKESVQGVDVTICKVEDVEVRYFVKDGMWAVCTSPALVEDLLARWDGKHDSVFANNPIYGEIMKKCRSPQPAAASISWYANPITLVSAGMSMSPDAAVAVALFNGYLPAVGLDSFKGMGGAYEIDVGEYDFRAQTMYYNEPPARGVPKFLTLRQTITAPPSWVSSASGQYIGFDWDLQAAWEATRSVYETILGPGSFDPMIDGLQQQPGAPNLHLKKDVIDVLSGVFHMAATPPKDPEAPEEFDGVLSIGITDETSGKKLVSELIKLGADEVKTTEVDGVTVYVPADDDTPGALAVSGKAILLASSVDQLKVAISNKASAPLVDSPAFQKLRRALPSAMSALVYVDLVAQISGAYELARKGELDSATEGEIDFDLLPPFEAISKYLQPLSLYYTPDEHGYIETAIQLKRAR